MHKDIKSPAGNGASIKTLHPDNSTALQENQVYITALELLNRGFPVFPANGKIPCSQWQQYQHNLISPEVFTNLFLQNPNANIGIITGKLFGTFVLDIDGLEGLANLRKLEEKYGVLPQSWEVISGSGGQHIYFKYPEHGKVKTSAGQVAPHIDVRGEGGFIICPPSIHPSGRKYEWSVDSAEEIATAPEWLLKLVMEKPEKAKTATPSHEWLELIRSGVNEGGRNSAIARISGMLLRKGIDPYVTLELCQAWNEGRCAPPLEQAEVITTVNSIAGAELNRRQGVKNNG